MEPLTIEAPVPPQRSSAAKTVLLTALALVAAVALLASSHPGTTGFAFAATPSMRTVASVDTRAADVTMASTDRRSVIAAVIGGAAAAPWPALAVSEEVIAARVEAAKEKEAAQEVAAAAAPAAAAPKKAAVARGLPGPTLTGKPLAARLFGPLGYGTRSSLEAAGGSIYAYPGSNALPGEGKVTPRYIN